MKHPGAEARAAELYLDFPEPTPALAPVAYVTETAGLCTVAQALPIGEGRLQYRGRVGQDVSLDQARAAVRLATVFALAQLRAHYRSLDRIAQICELRVQLATTPEFRDHVKTLDAASQLLGDLFGKPGTHARSVHGVASLPDGACASVTLVVRVG